MCMSRKIFLNTEKIESVTKCAEIKSAQMMLKVAQVTSES